MTTESATPVCVAALYRFAPIKDREAVQAHLLDLCGSEVRGTLLVAHEGLNGTIAGPDAAVARVVDGVRAMPGFDRLAPRVAAHPASAIFGAMYFPSMTRVIRGDTPLLDAENRIKEIRKF